MEQVVVEIDTKSGKIYKGLSEEGKLQFQRQAILIIEKALRDAKLLEDPPLLAGTNNGSE
jgi:hypothetical protein